MYTIPTDYVCYIRSLGVAALLTGGLLLSPARAQQSATAPPPEAKPVPAASPTPSYPTAAPPMAPGPFTITSADGKSRLKVGGLIQSYLHAFAADNGRTGNSAFSLRRVRPILDGVLFDFVEFRLMPEFG
ncbi:MAG: hypothetical protein H7Y38_08370, partial [Armatimonadetes bacterium]|nr:hypothetical protein [Armatimonadota bacterium]